MPLCRQLTMFCPAQILRVIDSLQLTAKHSVATPVNWTHGNKVMVVPSVSDEQATRKVCFPALVGEPDAINTLCRAICSIQSFFRDCLFCQI